MLKSQPEGAAGGAQLVSATAHAAPEGCTSYLQSDAEHKSQPCSNTSETRRPRDTVATSVCAGNMCGGAE